VTDSGTVYWINNDPSFPAVNAANENGTAYTGPRPNVDASNAGLALLGGFIYWVDGGTTPSWDGPSFGAMPLASIPSGAAFDVTAGPSHIYWTNPNVGVQAMGVDGIDQVFSPPLYSANIPVAIAIDSSNVYWTDVVGAPGSGKVSKAPLPSSGVGAGPIAAIATGLTVSGGARTLAVNATNAYFVNMVSGTATLTEVPIGGGGTKTPLATGGIGSITADAAGVYWVDGTAGAVFEVATGTTTVVKLASNQTLTTMPGTIAVDAAGIYWATSTSIMALSK
jgi:hypothetical protein